MTSSGRSTSADRSQSSLLDLRVVAALTLVTAAAVWLPVVRETPLRAALGVPFLVFAPGYALASLLFPRAASADDSAGVTAAERLVFSFGSSVAFVAAIGMALNFSRFWIGLTPVVLSVGGLTLFLTVLAVLRRRSVPPSQRFAVPLREWLQSARSSPFETGSRSELALNVVLAVSVLVAASGVVYALATPRQGAAHTEMYLLTENESGDLVADGYPQEFTTGEEESFYLGISNHEHETVQYSVVVQLQRTDPDARGLRVVERNELDRFNVTLVNGETWHDRRVFQPRMTGNNLRLTYLLYRGEVPETATRDNAYRTVDLKINVSA